MCGWNTFVVEDDRGVAVEARDAHDAVDGRVDDIVDEALSLLSITSLLLLLDRPQRRCALASPVPPRPSSLENERLRNSGLVSSDPCEGDRSPAEGASLWGERGREVRKAWGPASSDSRDAWKWMGRPPSPSEVDP